MANINVFKAIEKTRMEGIDLRYDMNVQTANELVDRYRNDPISLMFCSFVFGYGQGKKAERAERRREDA